MPGPLSKIYHKTREVTAALRSNCWYTFWQAAPSAAEPQPQHKRLFDARQQKGQFQVRLLQTGKWQNVGPDDKLFQQ